MLKEKEIVNYVTPHGVSSIVKHYLKESGRSFVFNYLCWFFLLVLLQVILIFTTIQNFGGHQVIFLFIKLILIQQECIKSQYIKIENS